MQNLFATVATEETGNGAITGTSQITADTDVVNVCRTTNQMFFATATLRR